MNNPLIYYDPSGEYWLVDDIIAGVIGGGINLISNAIQGNIHSFTDGLAAFGAGAVGGIGALYPEFGGWAWGSTVVGATNAWLGGSRGWDILREAGIGAVSGIAGGAGGQYAGKYIGGVVINGYRVASPLLKGLINGAITGAAGNYAGAFADGLIETGDFGAANRAGLSGLWSGAIVGCSIGTVSSYAYAKNHGINPITGRPNNSLVIGEGMATNPSKGWYGVKKAASDLKSNYYQPDSNIPFSVDGYGTTPDLMYDNAIMIEMQMEQNVIIYDKGPVGNNSQYYNMEVGRTMDYNNLYHIKAIYNTTQTIRILIIYK